MRILVTGANGQVGRSMIDLNGQNGHEIIGLTRQQFDLTKSEEFVRIVDQVEPDAIVNAAAYTAVDKAEDEPDLAHQINVVAPSVMASAAAKNGLPFIQVSTDYVFDGRKVASYTEKNAPNPLNTYGKTKLLGEYSCRENHPKTLVLRTSWVYSNQPNNFPQKIRKLLMSGVKNINVVDDQLGCPTNSSAIAELALRLCSNTELSGVYHFRGPLQITWFQFAIEIKKQLEVIHKKTLGEITPVSSTFAQQIALRPKNSVLNIGKIKKLYPDHNDQYFVLKN